MANWEALAQSIVKVMDFRAGEGGAVLSRSLKRPTASGGPHCDEGEHD